MYNFCIAKKKAVRQICFYKKSMIRYLFDCSFISPQNRYRSIPTYAFRFIQALPQNILSECAVMVRPPMAKYFKEISPGLRLIYVQSFKFFTKIPFLKTINDKLYRGKIRNIDFHSILIFDEYRECTLFETTHRKVAIIHDLKSYDTIKPDQIENSFHARLAKSCDALIAISQYTKYDVVKYLQVKFDKINVVYNSVQLPSQAHSPLNFSNEKPYILYVNSLDSYKNAMTLARAFYLLKDRYDLNLVFVGRSTLHWEKEVKNFIKENGFEGRVIRLQDITNEELKFVYEHASLFVTPSLHEGFGYTPIEAAICKCPVISSTCEALPETTRHLLYYYNPATDAQALSAKMMEVLDNPPSEEALNKISVILSELYNPDKQVAGILNVL